MFVRPFCFSFRLWLFFAVVCCPLCCAWKGKQQITLSEFFHLYLCTDFLHFCCCYWVIYFLFLKRPTNVHCDWCVSSFSLTLSLARSRFAVVWWCFMFINLCVCGMLSSRETENLFFSDRMQNKKEEMVTCSTTHTYIHTDRSVYIERQATTIKNRGIHGGYAWRPRYLSVQIKGWRQACRR